MDTIKLKLPIVNHTISRHYHETRTRGVHFRNKEETNTVQDMTNDIVEKKTTVRRVGHREIRSTQVSKNGEMQLTGHSDMSNEDREKFEHRWNIGWNNKLDGRDCFAP